MKRILAVTWILALACGTDGSEPESALPEGVEGISLLGDTLRPMELPENVLSVYQDNFDAAKREYEANREDADALIWYGRRIAYLGRYREAIDIFTTGIEQHAQDARLLRHRGHRFLSVRDLDRAVEDLTKAAAMIMDTRDETEPDGLPNAQGIPTSTLHTNIWYHLGLAHYLQGNFENALRAYEHGVAASMNPDMLIAMTYWHYMTLRRMGNDDTAQRILDLVQPNLELLENHDYYRLLQLNQGRLTLEDLEETSDLSGSTLGYGIGNWHWMNGRTDEALETWRNVLDGNQWAAFGYIAAEAELARQ